MRLVLIIAFFLSSPTITFAQEWEYLTTAFLDAVYEESMKIVGQNGWELVSTRRVMIGEDESRMAATEAVFKRQKSPQNSRFMSSSDTQEMVMKLHEDYVAEKKAEADKKIKEMQAEIRPHRS